MKQTGLIENAAENTGYYPALDTLRFIAVFVSFLFHSQLINFPHGHTFFFVLAAFILTLMAQQEYAKSGKFSFVNFSIRRMLRIFPLYFLLLFIGFILVPFFSSQPIVLPNPLPYLTFTANYIRESHVFLLAILWATSVQEQFYVFIGLCFRFLYKQLRWIAIAMIIISVSYKYVSFLNGRSIYFETLNHFSSFGIGILLAIGLQNQWFEKLKQLPIFIHLTLYVGFVLFFTTIAPLYQFAWFNAFDNVLVSLLFSFVILTNTMISPIVFFAGKINFIDYLGKISYGLYCYQGLVITFGTLFILPKLPLDLHPFIHFINLSLLIFVSHFSYKYFESPFLKLKNRFRTFPLK